MKLTYEVLKQDEQVRAYIESGNKTLKVLGFTEHSFAHVCYTAETAARILQELGFDENEVEMVKIAGFMHDIGNMINRKYHAHAGAEIARTVLEKYKVPYEEIGTIVSAIGNHDENSGKPANAVSAALIIADKVDVRRSRVQETCMEKILADIHDRVNYAVTRSELQIIKTENITKIRLCLDLDLDFTPVLDYFEIFLTRMVLCRRAADFLGAEFELFINNSKIV